MFDFSLREIKERIFGQFVELVPEWATPNHVTLLSFFFGIMCALSCFSSEYTVAFYMWIFNRILDGLDGTLARARNQQTDFGGYLDIIVDFIVYSIIPIAIAAEKNDLQVYFALSFMLGTFFVNSAGLFYLSALLEKRISDQKEKRKELTSVTMPPALIEGAETVVFYLVFITFHSFSRALFWIFGFGVCVTIWQRLAFARKTL